MSYQPFWFYTRTNINEIIKNKLYPKIVLEAPQQAACNGSSNEA
jgi:hypothetical protein